MSEPVVDVSNGPQSCAQAHLFCLGKADDSVIEYNQGVALLQQGRVDDALQHFLEAIRIRPDYPDAHNNLGGALHELRPL